MWLATERGFYSVVVNTESKSEGSEMIIRARKKIDLENLKTGRKIYISKNKDYAYRIFVSRMDFLRLLIDIGGELNYSNFKSHIKDLPDQKDKAPYYSEIWSTMNTYQSLFIKGLYNFKNRYFSRLY